MTGTIGFTFNKIRGLDPRILEEKLTQAVLRKAEKDFSRIHLSPQWVVLLKSQIRKAIKISLSGYDGIGIRTGFRHLASSRYLARAWLLVQYLCQIYYSSITPANRHRFVICSGGLMPRCGKPSIVPHFRELKRLNYLLRLSNGLTPIGHFKAHQINP